MAKSSGGGGGGQKRRPQQHQHRPREQHRERPDRDRDLDRPPAMDMADDEPEVAAATAVEPAPPPPAKIETSSGGGGGGTGEDVADFDQETNAKYEQVKGGKLYIRDLQQMDVHQLHEIAKQEGIQDYIGLKKQDLIFQILRSRIRQNGLMYAKGGLEIRPDRYGLLLSPDDNYLPCRDDI